jgi:hypothetical protein
MLENFLRYVWFMLHIRDQLYDCACGLYYRCYADSSIIHIARNEIYIH